MKSEKGFGLIEVLVAIAILATAGVAFLGGLTVSTKILIKTDTRETARDLAIAQMEYVKSMPYSTNDWQYTLSPDSRVSISPNQPIWWVSSPPALLNTDLKGYSIQATAQQLAENSDENIKSIIIIVKQNGNTQITLESYLFNSSGQ
jgi:prepilin-type N-terminal cleavage/methylation domain-containing protein